MNPNRKKRVHLSQEQKAEVVKLAKDHTLEYKIIAETYNISDKTVSRMARQAGIYRNKRRTTILPEHEAPAIKATATKPLVLPDHSLLEHLEETYQDLEEQIINWTKIKHDACKELDKARKNQQEHWIAIQAIKRANEAKEKA